MNPRIDTPVLSPEQVQRRRENRRQFLERLYHSSEDGVDTYCDGYEIAMELGMSRQDAERIARYHEDHGYLKNTSSSGLTLRITAKGVDHVETSLAG